MIVAAVCYADCYGSAQHHIELFNMIRYCHPWMPFPSDCSSCPYPSVCTDELPGNQPAQSPTYLCAGPDGELIVLVRDDSARVGLQVKVLLALKLHVRVSVEGG